MNSELEVVEATTAFVRVWGESGLATTLINDYGCTLTCEEADAFADLFRAHGEEAIADMIISDHAESDEPGDSHWDGE